MIISLFTQKCDVIKQTQTIGTNGVISYTSETISEDVKCKLDPVRFRSSERPDSGSIQSIFRAMLYIENVIGLREDMKIVLDGITYDIVSIMPVTNFTGINHLELEVVNQRNV